MAYGRANLSGDERYPNLAADTIIDLYRCHPPLDPPLWTDVLYFLNQDSGLLPSNDYEFIADKENGFVIKSKAPLCSASTAVLIVP